MKELGLSAALIAIGGVILAADGRGWALFAGCLAVGVVAAVAAAGVARRG